MASVLETWSCCAGSCARRKGDTQKRRTDGQTEIEGSREHDAAIEETGSHYTICLLRGRSRSEGHASTDSGTVAAGLQQLLMRYCGGGGGGGGYVHGVNIDSSFEPYVEWQRSIANSPRNHLNITPYM